MRSFRSFLPFSVCLPQHATSENNDPTGAGSSPIKNTSTKFSERTAGSGSDKSRKNGEIMKSSKSHSCKSRGRMAQKRVRYAVVGALAHIAQVAVLPAFAHASENSEVPR